MERIFDSKNHKSFGKNKIENKKNKHRNWTGKRFHRHRKRVFILENKSTANLSNAKSST